MASNVPVSAAIDAVLEQLGAAMTDTAPAPTPATLYAQLIRIRDEAVLLEVRASARDAKVAALLAELATAADRLDRLETNPPFWCGVHVANGPSVSVTWSPSAEQTAEIREALRRGGEFFDRTLVLEPAPAVTTVAVIAARRSGKTAALEDAKRRAGFIDGQMQAAAVENRWATICQEYLKRCDAARDAANHGDQP